VRNLERRRRGDHGRGLDDSFEGLPAPTPEDPPEVHDSYFAGWCCGSPDLARDILRQTGVPDERIKIVKGWFEHTLPRTSVSPIALLHVDSDWYASVRLCLETFYDAVSAQGVVVFDDYEQWAGCKKAADEFVSAHGISSPLRPSGRIASYLVVD
jgi:O-methyltransferase